MESVRVYSHYLLMKGQLIGLTTIDGHKPTVEEIELKGEIRRTCDKVAKVLANCQANDIASLTDFYSLLHTIGYCKRPEAFLLEKQRDRLLRFWKSGDKTIEESDVYGMLSDSMHTPMSKMPSASSQTFNNLRETWVNTLKRYNSFPDTDTYERYKRLALIMRDNVDSYFAGDCTIAKETWFEKNKITQYSTVSTKILTAYRQFVCSLFPAVLSSREMKKLDVAVLNELVKRKDLNDYDLKAYQLALAFETRKDA